MIFSDGTDPVQESITCPECGMTSYNPNDVREGYCGNCHDFTSRVPEMPTLSPTPMNLTPSETARLLMPDTPRVTWTVWVDGVTYLGALVPRYHRRAKTLWLRRYERLVLVYVPVWTERSR